MRTRFKLNRQTSNVTFLILACVFPLSISLSVSHQIIKRKKCIITRKFPDCWACKYPNDCVRWPYRWPSAVLWIYTGQYHTPFIQHTQNSIQIRRLSPWLQTLDFKHHRKTANWIFTALACIDRAMPLPTLSGTRLASLRGFSVLGKCASLTNVDSDPCATNVCVCALSSLRDLCEEIQSRYFLCCCGYHFARFGLHSTCISLVDTKIKHIQFHNPVG